MRSLHSCLLPDHSVNGNPGQEAAFSRTSFRVRILEKKTPGRGREGEELAGQQASLPSSCSHSRNPAGPHLLAAKDAPPLSTVTQRQQFLAWGLHSAGINQRSRRAAFLKPCCFLGRGRWGIGGIRSTGAPGRWREGHGSSWAAGRGARALVTGQGSW